VTGAVLLVLALAAEQPAPPVTVDADEVQYLYREGKVVFTGKPLVKLTREDATLTCRRLVAENDEAGRIRRAVCTGDVRLVRGSRVVTCAGNPVLRDGDNVMRGDELVYDLAADQATLSGARGTIVPKPGQDLVPRRKQEAGK
jgi:lipopolysaccharide export system protein LptA